MIARNSAGVLCVEGVALPDVAARFGTPVYVYSEAMMLSALHEYQTALAGVDATICVSVKANSNLALLGLLAQRGAGFDVVSGGELARVLRAGGDAGRVVFAGVGKTDAEIEFALASNIRMFNVESLSELERIQSIASAKGKRARVALRINPDVDAQTHHHISTGKDEHKFGVPLAEAILAYRSWANYPNLDFVGIDCHIGSMIRELSAFREAFVRIRGIVEELRSFLPSFSAIDVGGGLGVPYDGSKFPSVSEYIGTLKEVLGDLSCSLILEPGRSIFGPAGSMLTQVLYTKKSVQKDFVVFDAGFNDLIRPLLYGAYHAFEPVVLRPDRGEVTADLVGPICETGDCFAKDRTIQRAERGDLYVCRTAGAYGFTMASNYNTRPRPPEVLIRGDQMIEIRPREKTEELFESEVAALSQVL